MIQMVGINESNGRLWMGQMGVVEWFKWKRLNGSIIKNGKEWINQIEEFEWVKWDVFNGRVWLDLIEMIEWFKW